MTESKRDKGKALLRQIMANAPAGAGPAGRMPTKFVDYNLEHLFGDLWQGDDLALTERSLVTCTILVSLNREAEQRIHFNAARNLGVEREKLEGMIIHAAHYAGWPCAASAFRVLNEVWPEEAGETG